jgi:hypothetical protein
MAEAGTRYFTAMVTPAWVVAPTVMDSAAAPGGHHRKTGAARPLSAKTVRNIAGVVSSACGWALLYGLILPTR